MSSSAARLQPLAGDMQMRSLRVLMVEDSEDDACLLGHELRTAVAHLHYERVACARSMRAALATGEWDLIISDHDMPSFNSTEAFEILKETGRDIPFIIYSGQISEGLASSSMAEGVHDFVQKGNVLRLLPVLKRELKSIAARQAQHSAEEHVYQLAHYDELTGLPNRKLFSGQARNRLEQLAPHDTATLLFIDLDRFMRINNTFGYATGDLLVCQIADRLREHAGGQAVVARLGRDEFALLSPSEPAGTSEHAFAELIAQAFLTPFVLDGHEFFITLSMGVCRYPGHGADVAELLVNAESAMFVAKTSGRNNYQMYVPKPNSAAVERHALETALRHAVKNGELVLQYQPCVDIGSGRITGTEALVRWKHPELGMLSPDKFIPLADEIGMITEIGEWVLFEACRQTRDWHDLGFDWLNIAVNVSAVQFRGPHLVGTVAQALGSSGLKPQHLDLEITESALMQDMETAIATLRALKQMGVRVSVDDFGTGYSSLAYLKRFPIDTLKVDRSFTRDVTVDREDAAIVRAIITLAKSLDLMVIAEGVETSDQLDFLRREQCDCMQGYLFSKPLDPALLLKLLTSEKHL